MRNDIRSEANKKDHNLENILATLNNIFLDDENKLIADFTEPEWPPVFIVGNARSGTTLLYQWLASTGLFAYPSNIISRFYNAPYIGALIHKAFVDLDKHGEIFGKEKITFESKLGKSKTANSPHEFWYFWRRFFKFGEIQKLTEKQLEQIDTRQFLRELAALENAFNRPLLMKAMILNWNLDFLQKILPHSIFIHIKREPLLNMHSLFTAREMFFGNSEEWYSFKPPEYEWLKERNIYEQLAGQVLYTDKAVEEAVSKRENYISIDYKELCSNRFLIIEKLQDLFENQGYPLNSSVRSDKHSFAYSDKISNNEFDKDKAKKALKMIEMGDFDKEDYHNWLC